jgi:hypothetical protein
MVTALSAAALLGASLLLLPLIGSEFLPPSDEGEVRVTGKMEIGTRLDWSTGRPAHGADRSSGRTRNDSLGGQCRRLGMAGGCRLGG